MKLSSRNDTSYVDSCHCMSPFLAIHFTRYDEMFLLKWSVSKMSEILENKCNFMEVVFHWVTKTIKITSWKIICTRQENLLLFLMFMGLWYELKYVHEDNNSGSSSRRSNNDKIWRAAMRLKEIVLMFNWWFYDA